MNNLSDDITLVNVVLVAQRNSHGGSGGKDRNSGSRELHFVLVLMWVIRLAKFKDMFFSVKKGMTELRISLSGKIKRNVKS